MSLPIIYYATGNQGKFEEITNYLKKSNLAINIKQFDENIIEPQSYNQQEIAIAKARQAYEILQQPVLVDDSGIYFLKYHQFPGTMTKFIFESLGYEGILKLVQPGDYAEFRLTLVYYYAPNTYEVFEGSCAGTIIHDTIHQAPVSLPYYTLFSPEGQTTSFAELRSRDAEEKYNYRIDAFKKFLDWYAVHKN